MASPHPYQQSDDLYQESSRNFDFEHFLELISSQISIINYGQIFLCLTLWSTILAFLLLGCSIRSNLEFHPDS